MRKTQRSSKVQHRYSSTSAELTGGVELHRRYSHDSNIYRLTTARESSGLVAEAIDRQKSYHHIPYVSGTTHRSSKAAVSIQRHISISHRPKKSYTVGTAVHQQLVTALERGAAERRNSYLQRADVRGGGNLLANVSFSGPLLLPPLLLGVCATRGISCLRQGCLRRGYMTIADKYDSKPESVPRLRVGVGGFLGHPRTLVGVTLWAGSPWAWWVCGPFWYPLPHARGRLLEKSWKHLVNPLAFCSVSQGFTMWATPQVLCGPAWLAPSEPLAPT